jgi:hypothetical protein
MVLPLSAGTIYTYTGSDFTQITGSGGPTTSDFITLSFELVAPLPGNLGPWNGAAVGPKLNWTMSDGIDVLSSQNTSDSIDLSVATDASGNIVNWDIQGLGAGQVIYIATFDSPPNGWGELDQVAIYGNGPYSAATAVANNATGFSNGVPLGGVPGTWSATSDVPEPAGWTMLAPTLIAMWFRSRLSRR